jgi:hypothetical protein
MATANSGPPVEVVVVRAGDRPIEDQVRKAGRSAAARSGNTIVSFSAARIAAGTAVVRMSSAQNPGLMARRSPWLGDGGRCDAHGVAEDQEDARAREIADAREPEARRRKAIVTPKDLASLPKCG